MNGSSQSFPFSVVFLHIPKTAGSTLLEVMDGIFDSREMVHVYRSAKYPWGIEDFMQMPPEIKRGIKVFTGHFPFGVHQHIPQPCKYITVLRDPVRRVLSMYNHLITHPCDTDDPVIRKRWKRVQKMSMAEFVESNIWPGQNNMQLRFLIHRPTLDAACTRDDLEEAKCNMREHFLVAGLTERFDEMAVYLKQSLGWPILYHIKRNITAHKKSVERVSGDVIKTIEQANQLDIELYTYASALFDDLMRKQDSFFHKELANLKKINACIDGFVEKINLYENSWSWRLTAPLRKAASHFIKTKV